MLWNQHLVKHCENKLHCSTNWQRLKPLQDATFLQRSNISTRRKTPKELYWLFTFGSIFFRTGFQPKVVLNWVYSAVKWVWILHELPSTLSANHRLCQPIPARRHYWSQNDKRKSHSQAIHAEVKTSFLRPIEDLYLFDKKAFCMDYHGEHISIEWQVVSTQYSYLYIDIYIYYMYKYFLAPSLFVYHSSHGNFCATDWKVGTCEGSILMGPCALASSVLGSPAVISSCFPTIFGAVTVSH